MASGSPDNPGALGMKAGVVIRAPEDVDPDPVTVAVPVDAVQSTAADAKGATNARRTLWVSALAGAVSPEEFLAQIDVHRGRRVVAYCTLGVRSGAWAAERCADGLQVENLAGGLLAWTHAGGALVTPEGAPTVRLHVYGPTWNLVHHAYEGVW